jgi:3-dehydroquinate synthase
VSVVEPRVIHVATAAPYDVVVGHGVLDRVGSSLREEAERVAVLHAPAMGALAARLASSLRGAGREVLLHVLPDAEDAKTAETLIECWGLLGNAGFTRSDAVVSVGGGATTDVAGFVAASWLRGVDVVHVPTTTLAMVDAAVGGKTGINTAAGKNLVGAFHEPRAVVVDLDVLADLPVAEHRAGLAEVVKAGFIADPTILDIIEADPSAALDPRSPVVADLVVRAIAVKAAVVSSDLRESATSGVSREVLNYGHTFAHAVEKVENYRWRHGHAVSVGMVFVAELAGALGVLDPSVVERHTRVLTSLGLPTRYHGEATRDQLMAAMRIDKKARGSVLRFVVLHGLADPRIVADPDPDAVNAAFDVVTGP